MMEKQVATRQIIGGEIKMDNFIKTKSDKIAEELMASNFKFIGNYDGYWTFINEGNIKFDEQRLKEVHYTNQLFI